MDVVEVIKEQIGKNPVILYMKGTPQFPQCGFSAQAVEAMTGVGKPFAYVNILEAPEIRAALKDYANWPTYPQLWIGGELVGGSDIILEMYRSGQLAEMVNQVADEAEENGGD
jgi:monothiol glutaredoxin